MPNPFPGMDPYLEGPVWTTVHTSLVNEIATSWLPNCVPSIWHFPRNELS